MYSWVRYAVAIYVGLALAGAINGPAARGGPGNEPVLWPKAWQEAERVRVAPTGAPPYPMLKPRQAPTQPAASQPLSGDRMPARAQ
jgi:hypothetical protein